METTMMTVRYEIQKGDRAPCKLVSIVTTERDVMAGGFLYQSNGTEIENFVCDGTHNYCEKIKRKMEAM